MLQETDKPSLQDLPEELIRYIFTYLPDTDVFTNIRLVNTTLKGIVDSYLIGKFS